MKYWNLCGGTVNNRKMIRFLQANYYFENSTPEQMVSSHWRRFQKIFEVTIDVVDRAKLRP